MPPAGHALWAEVGGGITFVTSGRNTIKIHKIACMNSWVRWDVRKPHMLASVGRPGLHGDSACKVYWNQGALRRNCRQKQYKTSFSPPWVFLFSRNPTKRFWELIFWHFWAGRARHPGPPSQAQHVSLEFHYVGGWLTHGDLSWGALEHKNSWSARAAGVRGGTKAPSTSTRIRGRRSAVEKLASPQQTSPKLHVEVWEGLLSNQGMRFSQEEEIVTGCVVSGARPSCLDDSLEPPGPGRIIRNMFGWSQLEKTVRSGVWLFRGALRGRIFFFPLRSRRLGEEGVVPHSVVGPL